MKFINKLPQSWVVPIATIALLLPIYIIESQVMLYSKGVFVYPLDDTFIHMTIAKNMAIDHVWGISAHEFASASSSIIYPVLLAVIFSIFGAHVIIPFIVNLICAIILIFCIQKYLQRNGLNPFEQMLILVAVILLIPLPVIVIVGMEHTLQILICFLFIYKFAEWIIVSLQSNQQYWKPSKWILLVGVLVTATRYEGAFLILIACLILIYYKQWYLSFQLGFVAMLPILIFGIYSLYQGSYFLPNPVLLKSLSGPANQSRLKLFTDGVFNRLNYLYPSASTQVLERLVILLPIAYLFFLQFTEEERKYRLILIFLISATLLHLSLGKTTWFFRYEVYLLGPSLIILGILFSKYGQLLLSKRTLTTKLIAVFAIVAFFGPLFFRSEQAFQVTKGACINIFGQQYQASQFLQKYYDNSAIAINDLGAMGYFTSGKKLDMLGLGSIDFAKSIRNNNFGPVFLDSMVRKDNAHIAILSNIWSARQLFPKWRLVAIWHSENELIIGLPDIYFYAIDSASAPALKRNLLDYEKLLPAGVSSHY